MCKYAQRAALVHKTRMALFYVRELTVCSCDDLSEEAALGGQRPVARESDCSARRRAEGIKAGNYPVTLLSISS